MPCFFHRGKNWAWWATPVCVLFLMLLHFCGFPKHSHLSKMRFTERLAEEAACLSSDSMLRRVCREPHFLRLVLLVNVETGCKDCKVGSGTSKDPCTTTAGRSIVSVCHVQHMTCTWYILAQNASRACRCTRHFVMISTDLQGIWLARSFSVFHTNNFITSLYYFAPLYVKSVHNQHVY